MSNFRLGRMKLTLNDEFFKYPFSGRFNITSDLCYNRGIITFEKDSGPTQTTTLIDERNSGWCLATTVFFFSIIRNG